ncbi:hypothetical protein HaLaN_20238 [Haematococcus lacustris]|uniref:Uncharacterized protein n=1 Tax=Haematococcus lacustris TaxID=44745 RepID=A0A699ZJ01_HAELA|nr:hypothetical protein HaLaN_20238 [Haematococcus lacustris]
MLELLLTSEHVFHANIDFPAFACGSGRESHNTAPAHNSRGIVCCSPHHVRSRHAAGSDAPRVPSGWVPAGRVKLGGSWKVRGSWGGRLFWGGGGPRSRAIKPGQHEGRPAASHVTSAAGEGSGPG